MSPAVRNGQEGRESCNTPHTFVKSKRQPMKPSSDFSQDIQSVSDSRTSWFVWSKSAGEAHTGRYEQWSMTGHAARPTSGMPEVVQPSNRA